MKAKLLKRMTVGDKVIDAGQIVEVSDWKNLKSLVSNRYIEVILEEDKPKPKVKAEAEEVKTS